MQHDELAYRVASAQGKEGTLFAVCNGPCLMSTVNHRVMLRGHAWFGTLHVHCCGLVAF